jgi:hypothetical protein
MECYYCHLGAQQAPELSAKAQVPGPRATLSDLLDGALPRLEELFQAVYSSTRELRFHNKSRQHILAVALHGTVLELAASIITVLKRRFGTGGWVLLRSLLEAYVDLVNITAEPAYDEFMHAAFLDQQRRTLSTAHEQGSAHAFLGTLGNDSDAVAHLVWVKSELRRLKDKGVCPLKVRERFKRAGKLEWYEGPYSILAQQSHNNLSAIQERHVEVTRAGFNVHYFRDVRDDHAQMIIDTTGGVLANSIAHIRALVDGGGTQKLEAVTKRLEELRSLWRKG